MLLSARAQDAGGLTTGLRFDGGSAKVTLDPAFSLANQSFTVEAWIWLDDLVGDQPVLAQSGLGNLLHFLVRGGRLHLGFWNDDLTGGTVLPVGEWVHVTYTYDLDTHRQRVWLDGVLDGERTALASFSENGLTLHIGRYGEEGFLRGRVLELRVWDRELTAAEIAAGRFGTPGPEADGLRALFTFDGIEGTNVPEAGGRLTGNTLAGEVSVVEPVLAPSRLNDAELLTPVAGGSLDAVLVGYTLNPAPAVGFEDDGGRELVDGVGPLLVWGAPWIEFGGEWTAPLVRWENATPALTFTFAERVRIDAITVHAAHGGGADGVFLPTTVGVRSPGGFVADFDIVPGGTMGRTQALRLDGLGLFTDEVTLHVQSGGPALALAEVTFDGSVLAERAGGGAGLSLAAQRYFGLDPLGGESGVPRLDVRVDAEEARFEFPRAADTFGVRAAVEWSTDLMEWHPAPHEAAAVAGREFARLLPPPSGGRAFFRLRFSEDAPTATAPVERVALEGDARGDAPLSFVLVGPGGPIASPHDPESLGLIAVNDEAVAFGEAVTTAAGGTLRIFADGTGTYVAPAGLPGGQVVNETFTYTVADRLGGTVRNQFSLTLTGENDAPTATDIAVTHTATAVPAGVAYRYFEGDFSDETTFDTATAVSAGRVPTFSLDPATAPTGYGLEMTGELFVPAPGPYTFVLSGNNASVLDMGETRVVGYDPTAPAAERSGTIELAAGAHSIRVRYFNTVEPAELAVEYSGPGVRRGSIPASDFRRLETFALDPMATASDPDTGDVLTLTHINGQPITENTPVVLASGAEVWLNADGTLAYQPAPGRTLLHEATDNEDFTYTVTDAGGLSATASVGIQLARQNTAPVANAVFNLSVSGQEAAQVVAAAAASDADGDALRIIRINGESLIGDNVLTLPSSARVSLSTQPSFPPGGSVFTGPVAFGLHYDAYMSFLFTKSRSDGSDAFTITLADSAGAMVDVDVAGTWTIRAAGVNLVYTDARFPPDSGLGPRTAQIVNSYRIPVEMVTYITDRQTGLHYGHQNHSLQSGEVLHLTFDLPLGIDLDGAHFFDRFDLEIDTLDGDPILYAGFVASMSLESLYSTFTDSFFRASVIVSPQWGLDMWTIRERANYKSGVYLISTNYGGIAQMFDAHGTLFRGSSANINVPEPAFAANLIITGICRTSAISRFTVENRNSMDVTLTAGSSRLAVMVQAGQTREFEVPYEPKIDVFVHQTKLGLFDSSQVTCPMPIDFTVTSTCSDTVISFTQVRNNDTANARTVRIESVLHPLVRSEPIVIGNGAEEFIQMNTQGRDLGGTEGRVVIILPGQEIIGPTFIFSSDACF